MSESESGDSAPGRYYCLKCGRKHREDSMIGSFHHAPLDHRKSNLSPEAIAIGIAFHRATGDRRRPEATAEEIREEFEALGFDEQFPSLDVEGRLKTWRDEHLIGDSRHTGKHWYMFLANRRHIESVGLSAQSFHSWSKRYSRALKESNHR